MYVRAAVYSADQEWTWQLVRARRLVEGVGQTGLQDGRRVRGGLMPKVEVVERGDGGTVITAAVVGDGLTMDLCVELKEIMG